MRRAPAIHTLKFQLRFEQFAQTDVLKQIGGMPDIGIVFIQVNLVAFFWIAESQNWKHVCFRFAQSPDFFAGTAMMY